MAYTTDLKSVGLRPMRVRLPPRPVFLVEELGSRSEPSKPWIKVDAQKAHRHPSRRRVADPELNSPGDGVDRTNEAEGADSLLAQFLEGKLGSRKIFRVRSSVG